MNITDYLIAAFEFSIQFQQKEKQKNVTTEMVKDF